MANFVLDVIGTKGQEILAKQLATLISKEVCESIRRSFEGPLLENYKEMMTEATKSLIEEKHDVLLNKLEEVIKTINVSDFQIKSNDKDIKYGIMLQELKVVKDSEEDEFNQQSKGGGNQNYGLTNKLPGLPTAEALPVASVASVTDSLNNATTDAANKAAEEAKAKAKAAASGMMSKMSSSISGAAGALTAGLAPESGAIPGYLSEALNKDTVKKMMLDGFEKFINYITKDEPKQLTKMFIEILKEQINAKFREANDEFKAVIMNTIQKKCVLLGANAIEVASAEYPEVPLVPNEDVKVEEEEANEEAEGEGNTANVNQNNTNPKGGGKMIKTNKRVTRRAPSNKK